jgi:Secretory lipase
VSNGGRDRRTATGSVAVAVWAMVGLLCGPAGAATASAATLSAPTGTSVAAASTKPTPPQDDPFYRPPAGYASTAPGTILRSRPVRLATFATLPQNVQAWQLLYRTTNYRGKPEATVTTVLLPSGGKPRALVSYQIAEDAVAPQCAPSYELRPGAGSGGTVNQAEILLIDAAVAQGFAVSVPDYEGPKGDFGAARQPGYAILDGLRAAEQFSPLGLDGLSTPVGIWGYSGGSLASGWAAQVQPTYAPDLNLRGVAMGGFVTNAAQAFQQINGGPGAGLIVSVLSGVSRTVPALAAALHTYATPAGKAALAKGASQCETPNVIEYGFTNVSDYLTVPLAQFLAIPAVKTAMARLNLGRSTPTVPLFVYHAVHDELIPIAGVDTTVKRYCSNGDSVTYTRDMASEHITLALIGAPAALSWLTHRLTGGAVPHGCTTTTVPSMLLSAAALQGLAPFLLGDVLALLDQPVGPADYN